MKKRNWLWEVLAIAAFVFGMVRMSHAALVGKLDLSFDPAAVLARDYTDGYWMGGVEKQAWGLWETSSNAEVFYVAGQYLHGINGGNQSAGLVVGVPMSVFGAFGQGAQNAASSLVNVPGWVQYAANATSIELGGGYNFFPEYSYIHPWFATVSMVVKLPVPTGASL